MKLLEIDLGKDSFGNDTKRQRKAKINKLYYLKQTKKILHSKINNQQNEKKTYRMGENSCKQ